MNEFFAKNKLSEVIIDLMNKKNPKKLVLEFPYYVVPCEVDDAEYEVDFGAISNKINFPEINNAFQMTVGCNIK